MSEWKAGSSLSAVNASAGKEPVQVPVALFETIEAAMQVARQTDGAFDPTWAVMWKLWMKKFLILKRFIKNLDFHSLGKSKVTKNQY